MANLLYLAVFLLLFSHIQTIARAPKPYCTNKLPIKRIPLTFDQTLSHNMVDAFGGYNLNISLSQNNFATITRKWSTQDRLDQPIPNIISLYVQPRGNSVGRDSFLLYKEANGDVMLSYGTIDPNDKGKLPHFNTTVKVTSDNQTYCYDAALFLEHGLAIVDCAKKSKSFFASHDNIFIVVDLVNGKELNRIPNDLFIPFSQINRRSLLKFSHPQAGGFTYMLRTYYADGVDQANRDNTYMQIFMVPVQQPTAIQLLKVIDRTFFPLKVLRIMDVQVYMDDIFLLDYDTGLYRLDILKSQRVAVIGRYQAQGYLRFGVSSYDLTDELYIALANSHSIIDVDWHIMSKGRIIAKYSLMENSNVTSVTMNNRYIIVQSSAKTFNQTVGEFEVDYTWIFTQNSRTYLNAYHVIPHNSSNVKLFFDRQNYRIYMADQKGITLRTVGPARLEMAFRDRQKIGTSEDVVLIAQSRDPNSNKTMTCQIKWTVMFLDQANTSIFTSGMRPPQTYSVNYPKPIQASLDGFFVGSNIHYRLLDAKGNRLENSWIDKVNRTNIRIDPAPKPGDIVFFHSDVIPNRGNQTIIYYYQQANNDTHVAACDHQWYRNYMDCKVQVTFKHQSRLAAFASARVNTQQGQKNFYCIVLSQNPKLLHIYDFDKGTLVAEVTYKGGIQSDISSMASSNGFLYVLRKYAKTIDVYVLAKCAQFSTCLPDFSITRGTMRGLNVNYFTPQKIVTDSKHPQVMFIQCLGSLVVVDIDNKQNIHLLDQISSPVTLKDYYRVAVGETKMLLVARPDIVQEYTLENMYRLRKITLTKKLPTFGLSIQPDADIQFSDVDGTVYIVAFDRNQSSSSIMIYRTDHVAVNSLYSVIHLDKLYPSNALQIQVSGYYVNFLSIIAGNQFMLYRVFTQPAVTINEENHDFQLKLTAHNQWNELTTPLINITVVNQPSFINATAEFQKAKSQLKASDQGSYVWQDRQWFNGSVIHYNYSCPECHQGSNTKVRVRQHIDRLQDMHLGSNYYTETAHGGISVWNDLFRFRPNGSIYQVANLPDQTLNEKCYRVAAAQNQIFAVTACQQVGRGINLYVTSFASFKAFTWGPFESAAYFVNKLQVLNDMLLLVDTSSNPQVLSRQRHGMVYLYRLSFNAESQQEMDLLQVFQQGQLMGSENWDQEVAYLSNAHLLYSANTNAYRLYITQTRYGMFIIDFTKAGAQSETISIVSRHFVDLRKLVEQYGLHMPSDATFGAVTYVKSQPLPHFDVQNILVTTNGYHNLQLQVVYNDQGAFQTVILYRIYKRYAFYQSVNQVHANNGFIVIGYKYPPDMDQTLPYKAQYIALYDALDYPHESHKGYSEHQMIGAIPLNQRTPANFAINTTFDRETHGNRSGIVVTLSSNHRMLKASISHNLTLQLNKGYKSQQIKMKAFNDFSQYDFEVDVTADNQTDDVIIIIVIVLSCLVFLFFSFYVAAVMRRRKLRQQIPENRETLITEDDRLIRETIVQQQYQPLVASKQEKHQERQENSSETLQKQTEHKKQPQEQEQQRDQQQNRDEEQANAQQNQIKKEEKEPQKQRQEPKNDENKEKQEVAVDSP